MHLHHRRQKKQTLFDERVSGSIESVKLSIKQEALGLEQAYD